MSLQSEIDTAHAAGGGTVIVTPAAPPLTEQVLLRRGVRLQGVGKVCTDYHRPGPMAGTLLRVLWGDGHGASGDPSRAAIRAQAGTAIDNIGFEYPLQDVTRPVPLEYGATIHLSDPEINEYGISVTNNYFFKSYIAVDSRRPAGVVGGVSNFTMTGNQGCPVMSALVIDGVTDWQHVARNSFNAGFMAPGYKDGLVKWSACNGIGLQLGGNDWFQTIDLQLFNYNVGARITAGVGYAGSGPYTFQNCQFDGCWRGIDLVGAIGHPVRVLGCNFSPYNWTDMAQGCAVAAVDAPIAGLTVQGCYVFGPAMFAVWCSKARSVQIQGNRATTLGSPGPAFTAIDCERVQISDNQTDGFALPTHTAGSTHVVLRDNQA